MTTIQIKHRLTGNVLFECESPEGMASGLHMRHAVEKAVAARANLYGADLSRANLSRANLCGANLCGADLYGADLSRANLYGADLSRANLSRADLCGADLCGADLCGADLYGANLSRADLSRANLCGANLCGADLCGADLCGANLYGETLPQTPISISGMRWAVIISDGFMRIGCQRHTHDDWDGFNDDAITDMDCDALQFWATWREPLLAMCKAHASKAEAVQATAASQDKAN